MKGRSSSMLRASDMPDLNPFAAARVFFLWDKIICYYPEQTH